MARDEEHALGGVGHNHADAQGHLHAHDGGHSNGHCHGHFTGDAELVSVEAPLLGAGDVSAQESFDEQRKLTRAVFFALFVMVVEIVGGLLANSLAIITDAAHMLSDVGGFVVSLVCLQLASHGASGSYTYGFKQAEVLGALLSVTLVWALTAALLMEAFQRLQNLEEVNAPYMLGISTVGFVVNLILMQVLGHGHSHSGGHGHSHGGCHGHGEEEQSLAMKAAIAHVIGDIVQSLGVCLAALLMWLRPFDLGVTDRGVSKWNYADPACTVLFGFLVLLTTKATLKQAIDALMVKVPDHIDHEQLANKLEALPCVDSVHDLHIWTMGSRDVLCTAHLQVRGSENATTVLKSAIAVAQRMGVGHSTFQVEIVGEFDPSLETYGFHDNPVMSSPTKHTPTSDNGGPSMGHAHEHGAHGHGTCGGHGHSH